MFGNLLGHLSSAKTMLEKEAKSATHKRKLSVDERVVQKIEHQREEDFIEKKKRIETDRAKELTLREELLNKQAQTEAKLLEARLREHEERLGQFICTQTEPRLYWLPRTHNERTTDLVELSRKGAAARIAKIEVEVQPMIAFDRYRRNVGEEAKPAAADAAEDGHSDREVDDEDLPHADEHAEEGAEASAPHTSATEATVASADAEASAATHAAAAPMVDAERALDATEEAVAAMDQVDEGKPVASV